MIGEAYRDDLIDNPNSYAGDRVELFGADYEYTISELQQLNRHT